MSDIDDQSFDGNCPTCGQEHLAPGLEALKADLERWHARIVELEREIADLQRTNAALDDANTELARTLEQAESWTGQCPTCGSFSN